MGFVKNIWNNITGKSQAKSAANIQTQANNQAMDEQRRQFDVMQSLLNPYVKAGQGALVQQQDLMGLNGVGSQQKAISAIEQSPFLQSMYKQAENAILQNASATGGLRGGNLQGTLADNRMNMLAQAVQAQNQNLGALVGMGANASAGVGNQGMNMASNIGQLLQSSGNAQANARLTSGVINRQLLGTGIQGAAALAGFGGAGGLGGLFKF